MLQNQFKFLFSIWITDEFFNKEVPIGATVSDGLLLQFPLKQKYDTIRMLTFANIPQTQQLFKWEYEDVPASEYAAEVGNQVMLRREVSHLSLSFKSLCHPPT